MREHEIANALAEKASALDAMVAQRKFGPEYVTLSHEVLALERQLAETRQEPHAVEWSAGTEWNGMCSFPTVIGNGLRCAIMWTTKTREHAVLVFRSLAGYRLSDVGDEIIDAHPLTGKGLAPYRAFVVERSPWLAELRAIDSVHPGHDAARWTAMQHYLMSFKDRMFEALATETRFVGVFPTFDKATTAAIAEIEGR